MDEGSSAEESNTVDVQPRRQRCVRRGVSSTEWQSNVDTYRMANDGEGGRMTFLFERVSLGAEDEATARAT